MDNKRALQTVKEIKELMSKSSRFLTFSGTSTIPAGLFALFGAWMANKIYQSSGGVSERFSAPDWLLIAPDLLLLAIIVFVLSFATILFFSFRKARRRNQPLFTMPAYRTLLNFFIPLFTGGFFCLALLMKGVIGFIVPSMLVFYGLSLVNASKYTYDNIFWFGCIEIFLGLLSAFIFGYGLLFWVIGFGLLHILYGVYFYVFIERNEDQK